MRVPRDDERVFWKPASEFFARVQVPVVNEDSSDSAWRGERDGGVCVQAGKSEHHFVHFTVAVSAHA